MTASYLAAGLGLRIRRQTRGASPAANRRRAFTLLEVLLTMLIAGLIIAAIGAAIHIHFRVVDAGRAEVEQAQLARVLLRRIADDLRTAVPLADTSSTATDDALAAAAAAVAGSSAGGASSTGGTSSGGSSSSGGASTGGTASAGSASSNSAATAAATSAVASAAQAATSTDDTVVQPNFIGTQYDLQIDVTRLPDAHQFTAATSDAALSGALQAADTLSDVKTVSYYIGGASTTATNTDPFAVVDPTLGANSGGLIRRELSRAASAFAYSQGGGAATAHEHLLATEAVALEFHYYDGTQWLSDWDSSVNESLPVCVEILLTLRSAGSGVASDPLALVAAQNQALERTYRLVVNLPAGAASSTSATDSSSDDTEAGP